ncbi:putative phosphatase regulatory subunit-domain-containing protein [Vararia minispora EC-137]|uniref:Phosphatase regulatory subunit-domain-containing protein n=1 Tax=Vararia minispora EC-137 TaxID=1314806 RepID=A0ACB8QTF4_9AGAM|nr:putative phosphatase regulatory subunit-domain-containing protein [Vararia minispora EC-137]
MSFTRFGNDSAAPLPLIPRRASSFSSTTRRSRSPSPPAIPPSVLVVQPPTPSPPHKSVIVPTESILTPTPVHPSRHRRVRGAGTSSQLSFLLRPPEYSTPIPPGMRASSSLEWSTPRARRSSPIPKELMMTPRAPVTPATLSDPMRPRSISGSITSSESTPTVPLKLGNGRPLKSSLKSSARSPRPPLAVITTPDGTLRSSMSAPATPLHKAVHFDAKLEHVKLFLAEQKPVAVSRDCSPTDDFDTTSADEFPSFIYGKDKGELVMQRLNFPDTTIEPPSSAEVALESVTFAPELPAINGVVRVKNLAFEKRVAIRFTLDDWQTTSEVTGRYVSAVPHAPDFDRFCFVIKVHDLQPGRERALVFAICYTVCGREFWDNYGGMNYRLRFYREIPAIPASGAASKAVTQRQVEDLRSRLEAVVRGQQSEVERSKRGKETVGSLLAQHSRQRWTDTFSLSSTPPPEPDTSPEDEAPPLRFKNGAGSALGERYNFKTSFRDRKAGTPTHARTNTYPAIAGSISSVPWPRRTDSKPHLSPGSESSSLSNAGFPPRHSPRGDEVTPIPTNLAAHRAHGRHHSRGGGYFDLQFADGSTAVKRTPPGSPVKTTILSLPLPVPGLSSSPSPSPERSSLDLPDTPEQSGGEDNESALATPTLDITPRADSISVARRPGSPDSRGFTPDWVMPTGRKAPQVQEPEVKFGESSESESSRSSSPNSVGTTNRTDSPAHHLGDYHALLNKFCFYTGDVARAMQPDTIPRALSTTGLSLDDLLTLSTASSFDSGLQTSPFNSPDASGAATPIAAS